MITMRRWMAILWPSFLMAGVLEMLVFALVDPADLHWHGADLDWSRPAVYSAAFFVFLAGGRSGHLSDSAAELFGARNQ